MKPLTLINKAGGAEVAPQKPPVHTEQPAILVKSKSETTITIKEIAKALSITVQTAHKWNNEGRFKDVRALKLGGKGAKLVFIKADFVKWLNNSFVNG